VSIADQYPFNGYERRMREVYTQAIQVQRKWLEMSNGYKIVNDPRDYDDEGLIMLLISEDEFYSDVGFEDWLRAIDTYTALPLGEKEKELAESFRDKKAHFLAIRARFTSMMHEQAMQIDRKKYMKLSSLERSEAVAMALLGIPLQSASPRGNI